MRFLEIADHVVCFPRWCQPSQQHRRPPRQLDHEVSPMTSTQSCNHGLNPAGCRAHRGQARRPHRDQPSRFAATLGPRRAESRRDEPFDLEALQCRVDVGAPDRSPRALLDLVGDRDGIGLVWSESQRGQQDEQLEFGERRGGALLDHLTHIVTIYGRRGHRFTGIVRTPPPGGIIPSTKTEGFGRTDRRRSTPGPRSSPVR